MSNKLDPEENRKWFCGDFEGTVGGIIKTCFAGLGQSELNKNFRNASFKELAKWMEILKPIFVRLNQLLKRVQDWDQFKNSPSTFKKLTFRNLAFKP